MLTKPPIPYDLCVGTPISHLLSTLPFNIHLPLGLHSILNVNALFSRYFSMILWKTTQRFVEWWSILYWGDEPPGGCWAPWSGWGWPPSSPRQSSRSISCLGMRWKGECLGFIFKLGSFANNALGSIFLVNFPLIALPGINSLINRGEKPLPLLF